MAPAPLLPLGTTTWTTGAALGSECKFSAPEQLTVSDQIVALEIAKKAILQLA